MSEVEMPKEIWCDEEYLNYDGELEGRWNEEGSYSPSVKYTRTDISDQYREALIEARDDLKFAWLRMNTYKPTDLEYIDNKITKINKLLEME
jgi:hypothetical protein